MSKSAWSGRVAKWTQEFYIHFIANKSLLGQVIIFQLAYYYTMLDSSLEDASSLDGIVVEKSSFIIEPDTWLDIILRWYQEQS